MVSLYTILSSLGLPVSYRLFKSPPTPPYIVYLFAYSDNFGADNKVYQCINTVNIELYSKLPNFEAEKQIEDVLESNGIFWDKSHVYIASEELYETVYEMEILING